MRKGPETHHVVPNPKGRLGRETWRRPTRQQPPRYQAGCGRPRAGEAAIRTPSCEFTTGMGGPPEATVTAATPTPPRAEKEAIK